MLTIRRLLELVQYDDLLTTIDLKDAYFHVTVVKKHRRFLHFAFQGIVYEYPALQQAVLRLWRRAAVTALIVMQVLGLMAVGQLFHWGSCTYPSCNSGLPACAWIPRGTGNAW